MFGIGDEHRGGPGKHEDQQRGERGHDPARPVAARPVGARQGDERAVGQREAVGRARVVHRAGVLLVPREHQGRGPRQGAGLGGRPEQGRVGTLRVGEVLDDRRLAVGHDDREDVGQVVAEAVGDDLEQRVLDEAGELAAGEVDLGLAGGHHQLLAVRDAHDVAGLAQLAAQVRGVAPADGVGAVAQRVGELRGDHRELRVHDAGQQAVEARVQVDRAALGDLDPVVGGAHRPHGELVAPGVDDDRRRARGRSRELVAGPRHGVGQPGGVGQARETDGFGQYREPVLVEVAGHHEHEVVGLAALGGDELGQRGAQHLGVTVGELHVDRAVLGVVHPDGRRGARDGFQHHDPPVHVSPLHPSYSEQVNVHSSVRSTNALRYRFPGSSLMSDPEG